MLVFGGYEVTSLPDIVTVDRAREITGTKASDEQLEAGIAAASAIIRNFCGWHVAPAINCTYMCECEGFPELQLPAACVTAIESVKVEGEPVEFQWKPNGRIRRKGGLPWPKEWGTVEVKYTAGVSANIVELIVSKLAAASVASPAGVRSESIGSASITYAATGIDDAFGEHMQSILKPLKTPWRP